MTESNAKSWACALAFLCAPALALATSSALDCANAATQTELTEQRSQTLERMLQNPAH